MAEGYLKTICSYLMVKETAGSQYQFDRLQILFKFELNLRVDFAELFVNNRSPNWVTYYQNVLYLVVTVQIHSVQVIAVLN